MTFEDPFETWTDDGVTTFIFDDVKEEAGRASWRVVAASALVAVGMAASSISLAFEAVGVSKPLISRTSEQRQAKSATAVRELEARLEEFQSRRDRWRDVLGKDPDPNSLSAAVRVAKLLPEVPGRSEVGLDDDGQVFLHFTNGDKVAVLTVGSSALHLYFKDGHRGEKHLDDVQFDGRAIPRRVMTVFNLIA